MQTQYYCYGCSINNTDFPVVNVYVTDFPVVNVYVTDFPVVNVYVTDFPVVKVHVDELSSARIVCDIVRKRKYKLPSYVFVLLDISESK